MIEEKEFQILDKRPWWQWLLIALSLVAILLNVIMSWFHLTGTAMVGCDGSSSCGKILSSQWSTVAGVVPVSGLALGAYLVVLIALLNIGPNSELPIRRLSWRILLVLTGTIVGSAVWFTILQKWIVGEYCMYCMSLHGIGILTSILVIWRSLKAKDDLNGPIVKPTSLASLPLSGIVMAVCLVVLQLYVVPTPVSSFQESQDSLIEKSLEAVPTIGLADAPYAVTLLFDYQCSHCQKLHFILNEVVRRYHGTLAFVLCPTPLEHGCNPYVPAENNAFEHSCELARIGLAVWLSDWDAFVGFENWMFSYDSGSRWQPRSLEAARNQAKVLIGAQALEAAMADPWVEQYLHLGIQIFGKTVVNGKGGIPKLIYENRWVIPVPNVHSPDDLIAVLQNNLGVPEP